METVSADWDRPFSDDELQAIDAVFQCASDESRKRHLSTSPPPTDSSSFDSLKDARRRRLPDSLFNFRKQNCANSFSLSPCRLTSLSSPSSYQGDCRMRYQAMTFTGRIVYSRTLDEVEASAKKLLKFVQDKGQEKMQAVLGFDIEWRPTLRRGASPGKAAVMQICADSNLCYVMHIHHSGITPSLRYLLENSTSLKVGVNISYDSQKMFKDHNVSVKALHDLSNLANEKFGDRKRWSLAALTQELVAKQLPKPNMIRLGNWEADVLSQEQLNYAATDAFASWSLFQVLQSLPDAVNIDAQPEESAVSAPEISINQ